MPIVKDKLTDRELFHAEVKLKRAIESTEGFDLVSGFTIHQIVEYLLLFGGEKGGAIIRRNPT